MKPQLRVRTLLLPGIKLLKEIGRLEKRTFTTAEQQRMVLAVLDEISYTAYAAVPWEYSHDKPPYQGMAFVKIKEFIRDVSDDDIKSIVARVKAAAVRLLHPEILKSPEWLEIDANVVPRGAPLIFDHGVSYHWYKNYLQVRWVRPTIDYREMSVTTYFQALHSYFLKKHKGLEAETLAGGLLTIPMNKLLTSEYEVEIL
ncbi:hypothetical protein BIZ78_gp184 [Erwinia phage vB_EamM_Caitlin]|uniref:hypothetical protein n=1 Tax=Erwinia phage vB_EamM_Caitlin TaxID=1883379 RepID=UPI00081D06B4|nr:hypothetical protein BIZ78_gp184 [Erwinia phage vB_EamM_Caitlin]ANZ48391.1 hypothetical protein CAITLIN_96 [Erwinia phage vB_EamM_Caitlin]